MHITKHIVLFSVLHVGNPQTILNNQDINELALLQAQATHNCPIAQNKLGYCYLKGLFGVNKNYDEARRLFTLSASKNHAPALNNLGFLYQYALGVPQNNRLATVLYQAAVNQEYSLAENNLAYIYETGINHEPPDYYKAADLYYAAAKKGNIKAKLNLATLYIEIWCKYQEALTLFEEVKEEYPPALLILARLYEEGRGVEQNTQEALKLYWQAKIVGIEKAAENIKRLKNKLKRKRRRKNKQLRKKRKIY